MDFWVSSCWREAKSLGGEGGVALLIGLAVRELRLVLRELGLRAVQRGLERAGVDDGDDVALLHLLALAHRQVGQHAADLGMDLDAFSACTVPMPRR